MDLSSLNTRGLADRALDRRSLLKAGAWAAPAIAAVTAVPSKVASPPTPRATVYMDTFSQNGVGTHNVKGYGNVVDAFRGTAGFRSDRTSPLTVTTALLTLKVPAVGLVAEPAEITDGAANWKSQSVSKVVEGKETYFIYVLLFTGEVPPKGKSADVKYTLKGDGSTLKTVATPKTVVGVLSGRQILAVEEQATWK